MIDLRKLIIEWTKVNGIGDYWLLNVFRRRIDHGASPDDALAALLPCRLQ